MVSRYLHLGSIGGTERYLLDSARELKRTGNKVMFGWLGSGRKQGVSFRDSDGFDILPLDAPPGYVDNPSRATEDILQHWFERNPVDVVHFHTFSLSESIMAKVARKIGIPYVFTYHSPAWSCRRIDLLRWGSVVCDGQVRAWRCSVCMMQQRLRSPIAVSWLIAGLLAPAGLLGRFGPGKLRRRTAYLEDTARFGSALRSFLRDAAAVVACAEWSIDVLKRNGARPDRTFHCPQGVSRDFAGLRKQPVKGGFIVGYVGRVTPVKGVHILVEAFARTDYAPARLRIIGCGETASDVSYLKTLRNLAAGDPRIEFLPRASLDKMPEVYKDFDILAIPSIWLETGPLTLLEALACGVEVWGSHRVGQLEMLRTCGRVIAPNTVEEWRVALCETFEQHHSGGWRERRLPIAPRSMEDVAKEMIGLYSRFLP